MGSRSGLQQWPLGAEPVLVSRPVDPDLKLSALEDPADAGPGGETVAGKDNVSLFKSPAERLGLAGKPRAKAEKCLADAVYFEARGEPLRGQMAVAQVVMNRVFSGFYPNNVCGVVYQNSDRHLACQFTFACEGKDLSHIDELDMWEQAKRIAKDTLDGKLWLTEVGHATHYHAYWVHPSWVHEMNKMYQLGVHTFYRPRAWGDGSDAPIWGTTAVAPTPAVPTAENAAAAKGSAAAAKSPIAKGPEAAASPDANAARNPRTAKL
jgi:cell wall hydrolase